MTGYKYKREKAKDIDEAEQENQMTEPETNTDQALADFFAKGGKVQYIATGVSGNPDGISYSAWGAGRKKLPAMPATLDPADSSEDES